MEVSSSVSGNKPYRIKDVSRNIKKALVASTLEEVKTIAARKFDKNNEVPKIHLDSDGTEIDDEDYFQTLEPNTELIAVFPGEEWTDPTHYVTVTTRRDSADATDSADVERVHLKNLFGLLKTNLREVSVLSEPDLELLANMDPNSFEDITPEYLEQLKDVSGRLLHEKREAFNAIELLKLFAIKQGITINDIRDKKEGTASNEMVTEENKALEEPTIIPAANEKSESVNKKSNEDDNYLVNI